ncbi:MAG: TlpA family protein disulfide reductase [Burkholderiales bacterium]|nr:TlpA family protein disulfide reductase [Burkholderiales bacterium]
MPAIAIPLVFMHPIRRFSPIALAFAIALLILGVTAQRIFSGVKEVPEVRFATVRGELIDMSALRGRVVLVNFWATSCAPCVREMPQLADTWRRLSGRGFETVAVAMQYDPPHLVQDFVARFQLPFHVAFDARGEIAARFGNVAAVPATFLVDRRGRVILRHLGEIDFDRMLPIIAAALKEEAS